MKRAKILKASALSTLLLAGTTRAALAEGPISGEPYPEFFEGVTVHATGPVVKDQVATEAPGRLVEVEGRTIRIGVLSPHALADILPQAFIGLPVDIDADSTAVARAD